MPMLFDLRGWTETELRNLIADLERDIEAGAEMDASYLLLEEAYAELDWHFGISIGAL